MANKQVLTGGFGMVKIITMVAALLAACLPGRFAGSEFKNDRFTFMVVFGLLVFFWCLITFLLYLFDVTSRFETGTMRSVEIAAALFLLVFAIPCFAFAAQAAAWASKRGVEMSATVPPPLIQTTVADHELRSLYGCFKGDRLQALDVADCVELLHLMRDLNAATTAFIGLVMAMLIATIIIARKCGVPGMPYFEPAHP